MEVKRYIETSNIREDRYTDIDFLEPVVSVSDDFVTKDHIDVLSYFFKGQAFTVTCYPRYKYTLATILNELSGLDGISIRQTGSYSFFSRSQYVEVVVSEAYSSGIYQRVLSVVERNQELIRRIVVDAYKNNLTNHDRGYNYEVIRKTISIDYTGFSGAPFENYGMATVTDHPFRVALAEEVISFAMKECSEDAFDRVTLKVNHKKNTLGDSLKFVTDVETEKHLDLNLNTW